MEWNLMEYTSNFMLFHKSNKLCSFFQIFTFYIEHMSIMFTSFWNYREFNFSRISKRLKCFIITIPYIKSLIYSTTIFVFNKFVIFISICNIPKEIIIIIIVKKIISKKLEIFNLRILLKIINA